jgi:hypothetical protein
MHSARDLLFALTRQRFTRPHQERAEEICRRVRVDWDAVAGIAAREGVAPIVGVNLAACDPGKTGVPSAVTERLQGALFENAAFKMERRREFAEILADLDSRGCDVLLLKSMALEVTGIYEQPWVTSARDLDIALRWRKGQLPTDARAVRAALDERGVESDLRLDGDTGRGVGHHDLSLNGVIKISFDEVWHAAHVVRLEELPALPAYVMRPEDLLLTLCLNGCRKHFFRLKTLFDIAETVAHYPALDWDRVASRARGWQAEAVAFAGLRAADETLGLPAEARAGVSALVGRGRRVVLGSLVKILRRSEPARRFPVMSLQYAAFSGKQRLRSTTLALHGAHHPTIPAPADTMLPGE